MKADGYKNALSTRDSSSTNWKFSCNKNGTNSGKLALHMYSSPFNTKSTLVCKMEEANKKCQNLIKNIC